MRKTLIATAAFLALGTVSAMADCCPVKDGKFYPAGYPTRGNSCHFDVAKAKLSPAQLATWRAIPEERTCAANRKSGERTTKYNG